MLKRNDVPLVASGEEGRTVAIVGFAETSRELVKKEPETTEIWSLNRCYTFLHRWDRWFEVHEADLYQGKTGLREASYVEEQLMQSKVDIYMLHPDPNIPRAVQYPKEEIIEYFGIDYFTTSIAYMLALAAWENVQGQTITEVQMYGIDMSAFSEYSEQLPSVSFWLGVLKGQGVKINIPSVSPLLKCAMQYGRHGERPLQKMAKERLQHHKGQQAKLNAECSAAAGASSEYGEVFKRMDEHFEEIKKSPQKGMEAFAESCKKRRGEINQYQAQCNADLNATLGCIRETQHWIVALNAAQTVDEEPEAAVLPSV